MIDKATLKKVLGGLPLTAELYWQLRQGGRPLNRSFSLQRVQEHLPAWRRVLEMAQQKAAHPRRVFLFAMLPYWIEHATLLGMALAGMGHRVLLAYLPYPNWRQAIDRFDLRRHNRYSQNVLEQAQPYLQPVSMLDAKSTGDLPPQLVQAMEEVSRRDVQYTLQIEDVDVNGKLYRLRLQRNLRAAQTALRWMQEQRPDVVLTPNGSILEMGAVYQAARWLNIPVVTYEFGEQRGRIWLAQNGEVMRQETNDLWQARGGSRLSAQQEAQIRNLFAARQRADLWENFARRWQGLPSQGGEATRAAMGLDSRPIVLLAANVIGDSLTLGRQVFTQSMTEWLQGTLNYFSQRDDVQLVVRIHPGERYTKGPSVADVFRQTLPRPPEHLHLVAADDAINTYDLIEITDLGLVYTTTVGMEMAMSGVPVIVAGQTHYRGKGFTLDPDGWKEYFQLLDRGLENPAGLRMTPEQVDLAWNYAYRFFFEYPQPFPWHLLGMWDELKEWPLERVLSTEGQARYGNTFRYLLGEPIEWRGEPLQPENGEARG